MGAQRTVVGLPQAKSYCRYMGIRFRLKKNNSAYRFGKDKQLSVGSNPIRIPFAGNSSALATVDVVQANVPFLIDLDIMDSLGVFVDVVQNRLRCPRGKWSILIVRKLGHVYLEWEHSDDILFSKSEMLRLHRGFQYPTNDKL